MLVSRLFVLPDPARDPRGRLERGGVDRHRRRRPPGLVGQPVHQRLRHVPQAAVASVVGLGGMAGSIGGILFPLYSGKLLDRFQAAGNVTAGYAVLFTICGSAYLVAFAINHLLAPRFEPLDLAE